MNLISGTRHSCEKEEVRIYGTPGVHNNFPKRRLLARLNGALKSLADCPYSFLTHLEQLDCSMVEFWDKRTPLSLIIIIFIFLGYIDTIEF